MAKCGDRVKCAKCGAAMTAPPDHLQFRMAGGLACLECLREWHLEQAKVT